MARAYRARCIVLGKTKLGETDCILTMLASDGTQIRAVAKGLRRPGSRFGARLEPFSVVDLLLHSGRNLDVVGEARSVDPNAACREGLCRPAACAVAAELLERMGRDGVALGERCFSLTQTAFTTLGDAREEQAGLLTAAHLFKAMAMQGVRPATRECAFCGQSLRQARCFDVSAGGCLCEACASGRGSAEDAALSGWVDTLLHSTFADLSGIEDAPVHRLLEAAGMWAQEHLSLNLRSLTFLKSLY